MSAVHTTVSRAAVQSNGGTTQCFLYRHIRNVPIHVNCIYVSFTCIFSKVVRRDARKDILGEVKCHFLWNVTWHLFLITVESDHGNRCSIDCTPLRDPSFILAPQSRNKGFKMNFNALIEWHMSGCWPHVNTTGWNSSQVHLYGLMKQNAWTGGWNLNSSFQTHGSNSISQGCGSLRSSNLFIHQW